MRFLSLCSGIDAASVAWNPLGWRAVAFSEIDAFPSAVLAHHYPTVSNLGDMTRFQEWPDAAACDVLIGGTPCQSFSVAGLRGGLDDPRGNLMLTFAAVARRYRPAWVVWENVPGVLSSNGGRDFAAFVWLMGQCGYFGAWRVLDAQYFGLAQRRKRVFAVFHSRDWRRAASVLFERESMRGHPAPSRETGERVAPTLSASLDRGGTSQDAANGLMIAFGGNNTKGPIDTATACNAHGGSGRMDFESETLLVTLAFDARQSDVLQYGDRSGPLDTDGHSIAIQQAMHVRRLTPLECERLQGFPDDYTLIPYRGKLAADGPRYKALGNSMAVPVIRWIGERIALLHSRLAA